MTLLGGLVLCGTALGESAPSFDAKNVMIIGETLHFVDPPPRGAVAIAVVYNPAVPGSEREAGEIVAAFNGTTAVSGIAMKPFPVSLAQVATTDFGAVISALGAGTPALQQSTIAHHAPCITSHREQVANGFCQIYVTALPDVEIRINQAASDAANVHFATAFRIMVSPI